MNAEPEVKDTDVLLRWRADPELFVREALRVAHPTKQQLEGIDALRTLVNAKDKRRRGVPLSDAEEKVVDKVGISIMSGKGTGKDAFAAWAVPWFLICFKRPLVPCTAPTQHQLRDVLWSEIAKWMSHSEAEHRATKGGDTGFHISEWLTWQSDKIFLTDRRGRDWMAIARTASRHATAEEQKATLAGLHEEFMMVVADEASEILNGHFAQLDDTLTGAVNIALVIFNPNHRTGFAIGTQGLSAMPIENERARWICLRWNAEESENVSRESIERKVKKYGVTSNFYRVSVLGLPPLQDDDTLIPWDLAMDAVDRDVVPLDDDPVVVGIDVARYGSDKTIFCVMQGPKMIGLYEYSQLDTEQVAGWAMGLLNDVEPDFVFVDTIGIGAGVADKLRHRTTFEIIDVNVQEVPAEDDRFHRLRDELLWRVRERCEERNISIINDEELIGEMTTPKYEMPDGKLQVWSKKKMKAMGLASPNKFDALALCQYFTQDFLRSDHAKRKGQGRRKPQPGVSWRTV